MGVSLSDMDGHVINHLSARVYTGVLFELVIKVLRMMRIYVS